MAEEELKGKSFTGLSGMLRTSPWLAGEDLVGLGDVEAEIEDVILYAEVTFDRGRKERDVPALKFKGKAKQLVLRATANRKALIRAYSSDTKQWRGKIIKLYFDPDVKFGGKAVGGIRIREQ